VPGPYTFNGPSTLGYQDYRDLTTGRMLVADPGESYAVAAVDPALPVPPPDGRWSGSGRGDTVFEEATWEPPPSPPPVPEVPEVPSVPEPGEGEQA
jgi:hypothetical protein